MSEKDWHSLSDEVQTASFMGLMHYLAGIQAILGRFGHETGRSVDSCHLREKLYEEAGFQDDDVRAFIAWAQQIYWLDPLPAAIEAKLARK